jgi:hypothetical protein
MQQWEKSIVKTCSIFGMDVIHIFYEMILNLLYLHLKPMAGYMEPSSWILYHGQFRFLHFPHSYSLFDVLFQIVFIIRFFENKYPLFGLCLCGTFKGSSTFYCYKSPSGELNSNYHCIILYDIQINSMKRVRFASN